MSRPSGWSSIVDHGSDASGQGWLRCCRKQDELTAIMVASRKTILANNRESRIENRK
jgi:hypothetical protein